MSEIFSSWAVSVTIAILFSAMISMMLPDTNIKKYIKVVLGIVVTMIILSPLFALINGNDAKEQIDNAIKSVDEMSDYDHNSTKYTDYIFDLYEVYIADE